MAENRGIILPDPSPSRSPTPETDKTKLDKLLKAKTNKRQNTKNDIAKIGSRPPGTTGGRLESLQRTLGLLEREIKVLQYTAQLYDMAQDLTKGEKIDKDNENQLWTAIGVHSLSFHREDDKGWDAGVWKLVDPVLEQLWGDLGNPESFQGSDKTHATGVDH